MSSEAMRRYVVEVLHRRADEYAWPALAKVGDLAGGPTPGGPPEVALQACRAAGGSDEAAYPAAASLHALHAAIHLVDDLIDGEDRPVVDLPPALRANLALALQCIAAEAAPPGTRAALMLAAAAAGRETSRGQELDAGGADDEEAYWRIVESKTPPLFAAALRMGALAGGATGAAADALAAAAVPIGVLVQLGDDVGDVMGAALHPDWQRPGDNLALRFALEADHPERDRFRELIANASDPAARAEAQAILVRSGAFSFCVHHMRISAGEARRAVLAAPLADHAPVLELLDHLAGPVEALLAQAGVDADELEPALA